MTAVLPIALPLRVPMALGSGLAGAYETSDSWLRAASFDVAASAGGTIAPGLIADFRRGRFALPMGMTPAEILAATPAQISAAMRACSFADVATFTRSSAGWYVDADGQWIQAAVNTSRFDWSTGKRRFLLEGSATNLWINSAIGATQSFATTAQAYTLSFFGAGSITLSGSYVGTLIGSGAGVRVSLSFTATAGTLTATVSGDVVMVQLEAASRATSYIQTAGATATRAADSCRLTDRAAAVLQRASAGVILQASGLRTGGGRMIGGASYSRLIGFSGAATSISLGATVAYDLAAVTTPLPDMGVAAGWDATGKAGSYQGGAAVLQASALDTDLSSIYLGRDAVGNCATGLYDRLIAYPARPANTALPGKAVAYV